MNKNLFCILLLFPLLLISCQKENDNALINSLAKQNYEALKNIQDNIENGRIRVYLERPEQFEGVQRLFDYFVEETKTEVAQINPDYADDNYASMNLEESYVQFKILSHEQEVLSWHYIPLDRITRIKVLNEEYSYYGIEETVPYNSLNIYTDILYK